jgi:predicted amidohydrolase
MARVSRLRVAAAQYPIELLPGWDDYRAKLARWVAEAAAAGAQLLVFPEYGGMELSGLLPSAERGDLARSLGALQAFVPGFKALHAELARRHHVHIVASSLPLRQQGGTYRNTALLFAPDGAIGAQEKLMMTRFERERWGIEGGEALRVFDTALGRLAIAICYDAEFPLLVRRQAEAGARLILVPSCTDTLAGYHRVRLACRARALESQCVVVQAPTVGAASWSPAVDMNTGAAGIFVPPDYEMPEDGVLTEGVIDAPQWLHAEVDLDAVARLRREGQVLNDRDWLAQDSLRPVDLESLV